MTSSVDAGIKLSIVNRVASIVIDRRQRRNALALATMDQLGDAIEVAARNPDVWAIVLRGEGDEAFCAGADLKESAALANAGRSYPHPMSGVRRNLFEALLEVTKPTIAAINGVALGAGCELTLACDIRLMSRHATLGLPEAKRGMGANFGSVMLPRLIPRAIAFDMLYTGRSVGAEEAVRIGLVNHIIEPADFDNAVEDYVRMVTGNAPLTLQRYKHMALKGWELPVHAALRLDAGPNPYTSEDRVEGSRAFLEKRAPVWSGR